MKTVNQIAKMVLTRLLSKKRNEKLDRQTIEFTEEIFPIEVPVMADVPELFIWGMELGLRQVPKDRSRAAIDNIATISVENQFLIPTHVILSHRWLLPRSSIEMQYKVFRLPPEQLKKINVFVTVAHSRQMHEDVMIKK